MSEVLIIDGDERLPQLARKINEAHASIEAQLSQAQQHNGYAVEQAVTLGDALNAAKDALGHGQWLPWLDENCPTVEKSQTADYMRLARAVAAGEIEISGSAGYLSIRSAIKQLSTPRKAVKGSNQLSPPQQPQQSVAVSEAALNEVFIFVDAMRGEEIYCTDWTTGQRVAALLQVADELNLHDATPQLLNDLAEILGDWAKGAKEAARSYRPQR